MGSRRDGGSAPCRQHAFCPGHFEVSRVLSSCTRPSYLPLLSTSTTTTNASCHLNCCYLNYASCKSVDSLRTSWSSYSSYSRKDSGKSLFKIMKQCTHILKPRDIGKWSRPATNDFDSFSSSTASPSASKWSRPPSLPPSDRRPQAGPSRTPRVPQDRLNKWGVADTYSGRDSSVFKSEAGSGQHNSSINTGRIHEQRPTDRLTPNHVPNQPASRVSIPNRKFGPNKTRTKGIGQRDSRDDARRNGRELSSPSRRDSQAGESRLDKSKKQKEAAHRVVKKVTPDVFIPSVVSVGNLAKLLNMRLGEYSLIGGPDILFTLYRSFAARNASSRHGGRVFV